MKNKLLKVKFIPALLVFLVIATPISANEIIKLNQFNNYLKQAQYLNASEKPQEAQEALQQAREEIRTTLFIKALKNKEIKRIENETQQAKPQEKESAPQYSITIKETPTLNYLGFTFKVVIKNISVKPYITNFGIYECNFIDSENNNYAGSIYAETAFSQAVFPDKSQDFLIKDAGIHIQGIDETLEGLKKCSYDDSGKKQCNLIANLKIIDCIGYIATDGKQTSARWGENSIAVEFPL